MFTVTVQPYPTKLEISFSQAPLPMIFECSLLPLIDADGVLTIWKDRESHTGFAPGSWQYYSVDKIEDEISHNVE